MNNFSTERCFEGLIKVRKKCIPTALKMIVQKYRSYIPTTVSFNRIIKSVSLDKAR